MANVQLMITLREREREKGEKINPRTFWDDVCEYATKVWDLELLAGSLTAMTATNNNIHDICQEYTHKHTHLFTTSDMKETKPKTAIQVNKLGSLVFFGFAIAAERKWWTVEIATASGWKCHWNEVIVYASHERESLSNIQTRIWIDPFICNTKKAQVHL